MPIERVIEQRGIKLRGQIERCGPCPRCGGHDRFAININKQKFNCRGCKRGGGDAISLVMFLDKSECTTAVETLSGQQFDLVLGRLANTPPNDHHRLQRENEADELRRLKYASRIWNEAVPIIGTPGEAYLNNRGIIPDEVPDQGGLRFHPRCPWEKGTTPCIVSRFAAESSYRRAARNPPPRDQP